MIILKSSRDKELFHLGKNYECQASNHDCLLTNSYVKNDVAMLGATLTARSIGYQQVNRKQGAKTHVSWATTLYTALLRLPFG